MKSTTPIGVILIGTLFVLPVLVTAKELSPSKSIGTGALSIMAPRITTSGTPTTGTRGEKTQQQITEKRGEILKRLARIMVQRMGAVIDRLAEIANRLDSYIAKEKVIGVNTNDAEASIAIARAKLADAKVSVSIAEAAVAGAVVSADTEMESRKPMDAGKPVRESLNKAKDAVFAAHKALVQAVMSLKNVREKTDAAMSVQ